MAEYPSIAGYRINQESPKPERTLSIEYLKQSPEASKANMDLWKAAMTKGANCAGREDEFSGDTLPTDRQAQVMCAGCESTNECEIYRLVARPAWGVFSGHVYGRKLEESMRDD
jgi:hypothetical protein